MKKEEFKQKAVDAIELYKTDEINLTDTTEHLFVLAEKYAKAKFEEFQKNMENNIENFEDLKELSALKNNIIFEIRKTKFPE